MQAETVSSFAAPIDQTSDRVSGDRVASLLREFSRQWQRIDDYESRMEARACRIRRRVASILEQHYASAPLPSNPNTNALINSGSGSSSNHGGWPTRSSHVRIWVSHQWQPETVPQTQTPPAPLEMPSSTTTCAQFSPVAETFTIRIEGRLLMGHLDHQSADCFDRETGYQTPLDELDRSRGGEREEDRPVPAYRFTHLFETMSVEFQTVYRPRRTTDAASATTTAPRPSLSPAPAAHLFQSPSSSSSAMAGTTTTTKSSRRSSVEGAGVALAGEKSKKKKVGGPGASTKSSSSSSNARTIVEVDFRHCYLSSTQLLHWSRSSSTSTATTEDANAWDVHYHPPPPPKQGACEIHSVVARIALYPSGQNDVSPESPRTRHDRYIIQHGQLCQTLFPHFGRPVESLIDSIVPTKPMGSATKKRKMEEIFTTADGHPFPPIENHVQSHPASLTMSEITMAMFIYLRHNRLMANVQQGDRSAESTGGLATMMDDTDRIMIVCDDLLRDALQVERLPFHQLQATLLQSQAIVRVSEAQPLRAVYIMHRETASNYGRKQMNPTPPINQDHDRNANDVVGSGGGGGGGGDDDDNHDDTRNVSNECPAWQFDMECSVPQLFPFRARELLRRVKRREVEYTSSRTKARYQLAATLSTRKKEGEDTDFIRQLIESAVADKTLVPEAVWLALAKSAPPQTEARRAAQLDAQLSYLLRRHLPIHCHHARQALELLHVCHCLGQSGNDTPSTKESH